jgi:hypothetical protein
MAGAGLPGLLSGPGPLGSDPFGGLTPFGFDVPQGDPGAIRAAAGRLLALAEALSDQERATRAAAGVARGGGAWGGSAADAYANYSGHVVSVCSTNAAACRMASSVLAGFAQDLATAQKATRAASADCERRQTEATLQQGNADQAAQDARIASGIATALPHPARAQFDLQASQAQERQSTAQAAATAAAGALENARRLGIQAAEHYLPAAQAAAGRVASAGDELRTAPSLPSVGFVPVNITQGDIALAAKITAHLPANERFPDSAALRRLAGGPLSPGTAAQVMTEFGNKQHAWVAAHESIDGSVTGAIPGPVGDLVSGVWVTVKGTAVLAATGVADIATGHRDKVAQAIDNYGEFVVEHPQAAVKQAVDWEDLTHGHPLKAVGEIGTGVLLAKGAADLGGAGKAADNATPEDSRAVPTPAAGRKIAGGSRRLATAVATAAKDNDSIREQAITTMATAAGLPHVADLAPLISQIAKTEVRQSFPIVPVIAVNSAFGPIEVPPLSELVHQSTTPVVVVRQVTPKVVRSQIPRRLPLRRPGGRQ